MYDDASLKVSILDSFLSTGSVGMSVLNVLKAVLTLEIKRRETDWRFDATLVNVRTEELPALIKLHYFDCRTLSLNRQNKEKCVKFSITFEFSLVLLNLVGQGMLAS